MKTCLFLIVVLCAGCSADCDIKPPDRSWIDGEIQLVPSANGHEHGIDVHGNWPKASPELWIRYELSLVQSGSNDVFLMNGLANLSQFTSRGIGVSDYTENSAFQLFDSKKPFLAMLDYEIWQGKPGKGCLLSKQSVASKPIIINKKDN